MIRRGGNYCANCRPIYHRAYEKEQRVITEERAAYNRAYARNHAQEKVHYDRAYRAANKERLASRQKAYHSRNAEKVLDTQLRRNYGISLLEYKALYAQQGGVCAVCLQPEKAIHNWTKEVRRLAVDHCHETGKVRGLLCVNCNTALGKLGDSLENIERMAAYVKDNLPISHFPH